MSIRAAARTGNFARGLHPVTTEERSERLGSGHRSTSGILAQPQRSRRKRAPLVSLIVPVLNEAEAIPLFIEAVGRVLERAELHYEMLFVDDGSSDDTLAVLKEISRADARVRVVSFTRNFGKEAALSAGLDFARGDVMIPIDVDLQDPPSVIPLFVERWREGYDVVYGVRASREADSFLKRNTSLAFYRMFNRFSNTKLPENAGDFRLLDRRVVEVLRRLPERTRFMKGLYAWVGFRTAAVTYERPARSAGVTKWKPWALWNFALDGLFGFSTLPLRAWTYIGLVIATAAFFYAAFIAVRTFVLGVDVPGYASIVTSIMFFSGMQLVTLGVIGEYIGRLFQESKARPLYVVDAVHERGDAGFAE
ncbi:MAG: glycosyltransferase family 2 protein [Rhodospirillaceae bacterium]